ncbi:MAG: 50S ribosomal protein L9 [Gloeomargarita sp. SKYBB_i_bin120]|nr:50S ribosomal protein L9 [Gloeomargarita sp. SKYG98]MCS7291714.1 50S ribosomal protein L9 [Gloeomargarita sp. SKYB120]MDW8177273.1 50S ribosomal protein L9 [Gloeomargarita sp. SKYBB_i_bin120]
MAKRVQVVLTTAIPKLGAAGDVVDVAPGYARNYLIPQGKAVAATPTVLRQIERRQALEQQRKLQEKEEALARKTALEVIGLLTLPMKAGEQGQLFGRVTEQDVAEMIQAGTGQVVDRRDITIPDIRKLGTYEAQVRLHPEVIATVRFRVVPAKGSA